MLVGVLSMTTSVTLQLTKADALELRQRFYDDHSILGRRMYTAITAIVGVPTSVPCPHSSKCSPLSSEQQITDHLILVHKYVDDPYGEDTAQTNAWTAWNHR